MGSGSAAVVEEATKDIFLIKDYGTQRRVLW